jgi:hypothetical protein
MSDSEDPKARFRARIVRAGIIGLLIGGVVVIFSHMMH